GPLGGLALSALRCPFNLRGHEPSGALTESADGLDAQSRFHAPASYRDNPDLDVHTVVRDEALAALVLTSELGHIRKVAHRPLLGLAFRRVPGESNGERRGSPFLTPRFDWLRGLDLNQRPLGYEPNELPGCSTPR